MQISLSPRHGKLQDEKNNREDLNGGGHLWNLQHGPSWPAAHLGMVQKFLCISLQGFSDPTVVCTSSCISPLLFCRLIKRSWTACRDCLTITISDWTSSSKNPTSWWMLNKHSRRTSNGTGWWEIGWMFRLNHNSWPYFACCMSFCLVGDPDKAGQSAESDWRPWSSAECSPRSICSTPRGEMHLEMFGGLTSLFCVFSILKDSIRFQDLWNDLFDSIRIFSKKNL